MRHKVITYASVAHQAGSPSTCSTIPFVDLWRLLQYIGACDACLCYLCWRL